MARQLRVAEGCFPLCLQARSLVGTRQVSCTLLSSRSGPSPNSAVYWRDLIDAMVVNRTLLTRCEEIFGKADPTEPLLVFVVIFVLYYTTSTDDVNTPWLIGFFAALSMAISTLYLLPALADDMCLKLKPAWFFAECFLFVLTGCVPLRSFYWLYIGNQPVQYLSPNLQLSFILLRRPA